MLNLFLSGGLRNTLLHSSSVSLGLPFVLMLQLGPQATFYGQSLYSFHCLEAELHSSVKPANTSTSCAKGKHNCPGHVHPASSFDNLACNGDGLAPRGCGSKNQLGNEKSNKDHSKTR